MLLLYCYMLKVCKRVWIKRTVAIVFQFFAKNLYTSFIFFLFHPCMVVVILAFLFFRPNYFRLEQAIILVKPVYYSSLLQFAPKCRISILPFVSYPLLLLSLLKSPLEEAEDCYFLFLKHILLNYHYYLLYNVKE